MLAGGVLFGSGGWLALALRLRAEKEGTVARSRSDWFSPNFEVQSVVSLVMLSRREVGCATFGGAGVVDEDGESLRECFWGVRRIGTLLLAGGFESLRPMFCLWMV